MSERFSEEEARRIFARAAERQHADESAPPGLSLAELQEIGRAAGLDPVHVAAAVTEVQTGVPDAPPARVLGLDLAPRAVRVLPGPVSDEAWEQMVARLRRTFACKGTPTDVGRLREWSGTNSQGGISNLHAALEPVEGGTRVTLETSRVQDGAQLRVLPVVMGVATVLLTALFLIVGDGVPAVAFAVGAFPALMGFAIAWLGRQSLARWATRRRSEFEALLDQFELIVRDAPASPERPALDLDALADRPRESEMRTAASRRPARS